MKPHTVQDGYSGPPYDLAEGVKGIAIQQGDRIYIPLIIGEGCGLVGRFLDGLDSNCVVSCVVEEKLIGMLRRRGFKAEIDHMPDGEEFEVWSKTNE